MRKSDIVERLRGTPWGYVSRGEFQLDSTPNEAADEIESLRGRLTKGREQAEKLREALRCIGNPTRYISAIRAEEIARAALSDETPDTPQDTRICEICDGGPGNNGVCTCGMRAWDTDREETTSEHIARDIREGRFPEKSSPQKKAICLIPNCGKRAPVDGAFCADHADTEDKGDGK